MKLHRIEGYIQQIYLAEYEDKLMLLDGASRADIPPIRHYITEELAMPFCALKVVVVTHMHPDHAGAAHKLRQLTGCKIVSTKKCSQWYSGVSGGLMFATDLLLATWVASRKCKPKRWLGYPPYLRADIKLADGEAIPGFEDWQVLETPGHTDRDLSVYHKQQEILYVADLMVEVKKHLISPFPIFHPNKYRNSLLRIYELQPSRLLIAHGGEVALNEQAFDHLMSTAPRTPSTHWRIVKTKLFALLKGAKGAIKKGK
jgi:glyoxylase-like metal-dependent hydrolase (beta-lactamase superfamily II)